MLSIAIISSWHVHTKDYTRQIRENDKARIVAMWDEDPVRGEAWAKEHEVEFIADYDVLLARPDIDAIVCCSPTTMHPELLKKAAKAGKHIYTEKLLATNTADCEELCRVIKESGVVFTISLPLRSAPRMLYAKQLVDAGTLGRITGARFRRSHGGVSDHWLPEHWFDVSATGGGAMMDLGAHPVYILSFLFGEPKRISGMSTNPFGTTSDENAIALVEFADGILATAETAFVTHGVPDILEIYGTEGSLFIRGEDVRLVTKGLQEMGVSAAQPDKLPAPRPLAVWQFIDACLAGSGSPEYLGLEDALTMTRMIEAFYHSDETNKTIIMGE
jgi:predicted dehydrogenase